MITKQLISIYPNVHYTITSTTVQIRYLTTTDIFPSDLLSNLLPNNKGLDSHDSSGEEAESGNCFR